jgi:phosphoglycolate phosphatase
VSGGPLTLDAVLFDLDGTLADTAPDLIGALDVLRHELGLAPAEPARVRTQVSKGGAGILRAGLPEIPDAAQVLLDRYLAIYRTRVCGASALFAGVAETLARLDALGVPWGIVTNKAGWLTQPLLVGLALDTRAGCVISGDTLPVRKPDPAPVRHACAALGVEPARAALVGDDRRDVEAARRAGAGAIVAGWGYLDPDDAPRGWDADLRIEQPLELFEHVRWGAR